MRTDDHPAPPGQNNRNNKAHLNGQITVDDIEADIQENTAKACHNSPEVTEANAIKVLESLKVDPMEEIEAPPVCISFINDGEATPVGTLGNISTATGKAKSKKTFFIVMAIATAIRNYIPGIIKSSLPDNQRVVLYFDTEQSKYHVQLSVKRICKLAGIENPPNLKVYGLRRFSPKERLLLVKTAVETIPNIGLVVIDGIKDLGNNPLLDPIEANEIVGYLMKWSEERNIHIISVLHQNKGDNHARGHLGTELINKSETVFAISRDSNYPEISKIEGEYCRHKEFPPFAFQINDDGLPEVVDGFQFSSGNQKPKTNPVEIDKETHQQVLQKVFANEQKQRYSELVRNIKNEFAKEGRNFGDNKAKDFITYYKSENLIGQTGESNTKNKSYYLKSLNQL